MSASLNQGFIREKLFSPNNDLFERIKFRELNNVTFSILCHRYAAHFRLIVPLLP